ncbi:MAG TPA: ABC transporter permease [Gemmatimonadaceae bacterium]|nr:ABC transporter permease [Gemmatimonadaceae bacterium]
MIGQLALRNITYRPWRSVLLFFGFGVGVAVMIVLLSIGEAMLSQARNEKLVGGGSITVLPEGLDVEVMKTGGIGGLFFSINHASFLYRQLFASPRFAGEISAVAPQIEGRLLYVHTADGAEYSVHANGEIPSATKRVGAAAEIAAGKWEDDDGDRRWISPTAAELRHELDHFHVPPDSVGHRETWAEWHYFNVLSKGGKRWAFVSFIVGGDVTSTKWGGRLGITLREQGGATRRFAATVDRSRVRFSTSDANLVFGDSRVSVLADGDYEVRATASEEKGGAGRIEINLRVHPAPYAYFPGVEMGSGGFVSGYTVPALRASASGTMCVDGSCEQLTDAQSYHDHNWGVWRGVTWDWGASRAGQYAFLYGRVYSPDTSASVPPVLVYLVDSLGFRAVFRPKLISYEDGRTVRSGAAILQVPSRATFSDSRGDDTLRVDISIQDAIATDTRPGRAAKEGERGDPLGTAKAHPYFIQMKGTARISGRLDGVTLAGTGIGFFETYR